MLVANTFWENFFLLLIFLPLAMIWGFALVDIFRRDDMNGFSKALWVTCVILVPFFGTLVYLIARPAGATESERALMGLASREAADTYTPTSEVSELKVLADLYDRGMLTESEYEAEKARVLGGANRVPA